MKTDKILVTGAHGFLGKFVCAELISRGYRIYNPTHDELDLMDKKKVREYLAENKPKGIIHLAALCGGIGANRERPAEFYYNNLIMGAQLMEEARWLGGDKFVAVGTVCAYPKHTPVPFKEDDIWNGYPEETNAPYGLAKKMLLVQAQAYRQQYGFNAIYLVPVNLYGPGDNFKENSSHVIPALIRKIDKAIKNKEDKVEVWGTGKATREFLYVEDCARGIVDSLEKYDSPEPMNLGTGQGIRIKDLVELIGDSMDYKGEFIWNTDKPDGQPFRRLDVTRARENIDWQPKMDLWEGLKKTIEWWRKNK